MIGCCYGKVLFAILSVVSQYEIIPNDFFCSATKINSYYNSYNFRNTFLKSFEILNKEQNLYFDFGALVLRQKRGYFFLSQQIVCQFEIKTVNIAVPTARRYSGFSKDSQKVFVRFWVFVNFNPKAVVLQQK